MSTPQAKRAAAGLRCAKKLEAAAVALRAYLHACNACGDASASLLLQGKGVDGREKLIAEVSEYASYLDGLYSANEGTTT